MRYLALLLLMAITFQASAFEKMPKVDSTNRVGFFDSKSFEIMHVGVPLIAAGLALKPMGKEFQNMRNSYIGSVRYYFDDYLQYSPALVMVGLKTAGVESRSSWGRMITSDALSVTAGSIIINSVKHTANVKRPDSNANTSFPSGHTATVFMVATMLHKEYGAVSPWISIGGYGIASVAGITRVVNNQHWVSDIVAGAGIGILSTEVGYLLADLIYKDRGINRELDPSFDGGWDTISSKSSVGFYIGAIAPLNQLSNTARIKMGSKLGVDGSYLIGENFGVSAGASINDFIMEVDGEKQEQSLDVIAANVGAYYAKPISNVFRVGAKAHVGMDYYKDCQIGNELNIDKGAKAAFGGGASIEYLSSSHWSTKLFVDYNAAYLGELSKTKVHQTAIFGLAGNIIF